MTGRRITLYSMGFFLLALLLFLIAYPYAHQHYPRQIAITEAFFAAIMVTGVSLFLHKRYQLIIAMSLALLILVGVGITTYIELRWLVLSTLTIELIFFAFIFFTMVRYVFMQQSITASKLLAAICGYLVLGIIFAFIYTFILVLNPHAFQYTVTTQFSPGTYYPHPAILSEAIYFSFVTLSTLGYGDWVPMLGPLKMLAAIEAILGQLYIAILIARLVGIHLIQAVTNKQKSRRTKDA